MSMEKTVFETEGRMSREEIAEYLRAVAESLDRGATVSFSAGDQSVTLDPPAEPEFEVKVEHEGPEDAMTERSIEFEIEWDDVDDAGDSEPVDSSLSIE